MSASSAINDSLDAPRAARPDHRGQAGPALRLSGVAKSFATKRVLHPFELSIEPGEIHALLGQNGSGKSTLIKILSGFHTPDEPATCEVAGKQLAFGTAGAADGLGLRFVHQDLGLVATQSVLDNMALGRGYPTRGGTISRRESIASARRALDSVGLSIEPRRIVAELSPAERTGVAIARAAQSGGSDVAVLVLDEPTATLPVRDVDRLHEMLRTTAASGVAIVYVTHHLDEVFRLADRVSILRDGHLVSTDDVGAISRDQLVHRLIGGELERVHRELPDKTEDGRSKTDEAVLTVRGLRAIALNGIDLEVRSGEIVGLYGLTGSGRESILGSIFGALPRDGGTVHVAGRELRSVKPRAAIAAGVGYLPPDRKVAGGLMMLSAVENLTLVDLKPFWRRGWLSRRRERNEALEWLARLRVRPEGAADAAFSSFSGGNQQKIVIGKWLRLEPRVLLLDEPTQGVDVGAKAELHRLVLDQAHRGAAVLVSSTDVEEVAAICDRVLVLRDGTIAEVLSGDDVTERRINASFHRATQQTQETITHGA